MLVVDLEASGVDHRVHGILSIGAIDFLHPERYFYGECRLWEDAHISQEALDVNGFTREDVFDPEKQSEAQLLDSFRLWVENSEDHTIAGHNPHFDLVFLENAYRRNDEVSISLAHRVVDLHSIAFFNMIRNGDTLPKKNGRSNINSDTIMEYLGLPKEPLPHNALNGAIWEAEAFHRFFYGRFLFERFKDQPVHNSGNF
ncbi:MAG: 3'-5' exoribonuclease domain-containing protein [Candidatus Paceibacterota bacterium]